MKEESQWKKNNILPTEESNLNENGFLIRNCENQREIAQCFSNAEKKKSFNPDPYIQ